MYPVCIPRTKSVYPVLVWIHSICRSAVEGWRWQLGLNRQQLAVPPPPPQPTTHRPWDSAFGASREPTHPNPPQPNPTQPNQSPLQENAHAPILFPCPELEKPPVQPTQPPLFLDSMAPSDVHDPFWLSIDVGAGEYTETYCREKVHLRVGEAWVALERKRSKAASVDTTEAGAAPASIGLVPPAPPPPPPPPPCARTMPPVRRTAGVVSALFGAIEVSGCMFRWSAKTSVQDWGTVFRDADDCPATCCPSLWNAAVMHLHRHGYGFPACVLSRCA